VSRCVVGPEISLAHLLWICAGDEPRCSSPRRCKRTRRGATEATRCWRVHPTVGTHTSEGLKAAPRARSLSRRSESLAAARERERRRNRMRLGLREAVERGFVQPETSRNHRIEMDGSQSPDRVSAQAGRSFPGPGPGCGLERGTR
jgi:hypothetical protein